MEIGSFQSKIRSNVKYGILSLDDKINCTVSKIFFASDTQKIREYFEYSESLLN